MRLVRYLLLTALVALACASSAGAAATVHIYPAGPYGYSGPTYASPSAALSGFKAAVGSSGFQTIDWDHVPDADASPYSLPGDFFSSQGALLSTPGNSLRVSATGAHAPTVFTDINTTYGSDFATFSSPRIFSPLGSNVTDVTFTVPGSPAPATVRGFGAMFVNVEPSFTSSIEYFDPSGASLGRFYAGPNGSAKQFSFLGVVFSSDKVARVRITSGTNAISASTDDAPPGVNVVALDDLAFADTQALAGPALTVGDPSEGATVPSARQVVSGTAADPYGIRSLTVNGELVAVGSDGSWSFPVTLNPGANAIKVVATNTGGASTTVTRNVTLAPPPPPARPSNAFTLRSLKLNPRTGKALAVVTLPGPGKVDLRLTAARPVGRLIHLERNATAAGDFQMKFSIPSKARKILKKRRAHAVEKVSFTPTGGSMATHSTAVTVGTKR